MNSSRLECTGTILGANVGGTSLLAAVEFDCLEPGFATTAPVIWSYQSVKSAVSFCWSILALWKFLRDLECSSGLGPEQFNVTRHGRGWASHGAGLGFSVVLNMVGILALIFMMLLGSPD